MFNVKRVAKLEVLLSLMSSTVATCAKQTSRKIQLFTLLDVAFLCTLPFRLKEHLLM